MRIHKVRFLPGELTISIRYEKREKIIFDTDGESIRRAFELVTEAFAQHHDNTPERMEAVVCEYMRHKRELLMRLNVLVPTFEKDRRAIVHASMWYIYFRARAGKFDPSRETCITVDWTARDHENGIPIVRIGRALDLPEVPTFDMWF